MEWIFLISTVVIIPSPRRSSVVAASCCRNASLQQSREAAGEILMYSARNLRFGRIFVYQSDNKCENKVKSTQGRLKQNYVNVQEWLSISKRMSTPDSQPPWWSRNRWTNDRQPSTVSRLMKAHPSICTYIKWTDVVKRNQTGRIWEHYSSPLWKKRTVLSV